jgi:hypothetical protein
MRLISEGMNMKTFQYHELKTPYDGDNGELYPDYPLDSLTVHGKMFHLDLKEDDLINIEDLFRSL